LEGKPSVFEQFAVPLRSRAGPQPLETLSSLPTWRADVCAEARVHRCRGCCQLVGGRIAVAGKGLDEQPQSSRLKTFVDARGDPGGVPHVVVAVEGGDGVELAWFAEEVFDGVGNEEARVCDASFGGPATGLEDRLLVEVEARERCLGEEFAHGHVE